MTEQAAMTFVILVAAVVIFIANRLPPAVVALAVTLALFITGVVTFDQAIEGFGDPVVVYLAGLYVVSEALDVTGLTAWLGQQLTRRVGEGRVSVLTALMLLSAALAAVITPNGAVAAMIPVAVMLSARIGQPPAQLLMPLVFIAHAGSMLTLLGTPINLLMSDLAVEAGERPFGFFEFGLVGVPLVAGTFAITLTLGPRLLPHRSPVTAPRDLSRHAETLAAHYALEPTETASSYGDGLIEVVIPPRSPFEGDVAFPGMRTESGELIVVAVKRSGESLDHAELRTGDVLLMRGAWDSLDRKVAHPGVVAVDDPGLLRRQTVPLGPSAYLAALVLLAMIVLMASRVAPAAIIVLGAAGVMVALRVVTVPQAERSISISTLVIVAGMVPMSTAIQISGAADVISDGLLGIVGNGSPLLLQFGIVVVVLIMGQFISNFATVLIVSPIALTLAASADLSPLPFLMGITVAGAASFLTPVATAANLMILDPGAYRFGDYWRLGLPLILLFGVIATLLVPAIWQY